MGVQLLFPSVLGLMFRFGFPVPFVIMMIAQDKRQSGFEQEILVRLLQVSRSRWREDRQLHWGLDLSGVKAASHG
jgi:hypothetical protein